MKVTLDLDRLLAEGAITETEHKKFSELALQATGSLAFNILIGFGVIAVAGAALALSPNPLTAIVIGLCVLATGLALLYVKAVQWQLLANICILVGALMVGIGAVIFAGGTLASILVVTAFFVIAGVVVRSSLLVVLATLMLSVSLGARSHYFHASYLIQIREPTLTILLFSIVSIALYQLSRKLPSDYEKLALASARTGILLINLAFWVGSLWGDHVGSAYASHNIAPAVFAIVWALALLATGTWAWWRNRRWVVNTAAIFAAIDLYTQWFEHLHVSPASLLVAGVVALGAAFGLRYLNGKMRADA